jgi:hypothetical protein
MTPREKALEEALRLCDAWLVLPLDRGGKCGPKGRAFDAFLTAKDAALSLPASAGEERPATAELRERVARIIDPKVMQWWADLAARFGSGEADRQYGYRRGRALAKADTILALPELAGGSIPAGWKLVPEEPTHEMVCAGDRKDPGSGFGSMSAHIYRAMLAAAPPASGSAS